VASLAESLDAFRHERPLRSVSIGGVLCRYRAAGAGTRGLLLLPGAAGDGEAYFLLEPLLRHSHRLIAISYPNSPDAEAVLDALAALAEHEGVAQVPGVAVHTFQGAGHAIAAQHAREWARRAAAFLADGVALSSPDG
jgi:nucleotide-binding universal stress UspA family protein